MLKLNYAPSNKEILIHHKLKKNEEIWKNNNRWTEKTVKDVNDTNSSRHLRTIKRFNENSFSEEHLFVFKMGKK